MKYNFKRILIIGIFLMSLFLSGCSSETLCTEEEVSNYIRRNYGKDFTLIYSDYQIGNPKLLKTWDVVLKDKDFEITFELENYLSKSVQWLDGDSFGLYKSYYRSTYAKEKSKLLYDEVLEIVSRYPDIEYEKDEKNNKKGTDHFVVYNTNYKQLRGCIEEIDKLYDFPNDTQISFLATIKDEHNNIVDTFYYSYSSGEEKLDMSKLNRK